MLRTIAKVGGGMKRAFTSTDEYLDRPYRTRRWLVIVAMVVAIGVVVYCNIQNHALHGESLLITLVGGSTALYGGTKVADAFTKDKLNETEGDI